MDFNHQVWSKCVPKKMFSLWLFFLDVIFQFSSENSLSEIMISMLWHDIELNDQDFFFFSPTVYFYSSVCPSVLYYNWCKHEHTFPACIFRKLISYFIVHIYFLIKIVRRYLPSWSLYHIDVYKYLTFWSRHLHVIMYMPRNNYTCNISDVYFICFDTTFLNVLYVLYKM